MNNTLKIVLATAAGLATGVALGILFAPDKGSETRRKMKERGKKFAEDIKEEFEAEVNEWSEKMKDFA